jgi:signal transduction histidine kinase
MRFNSLAFRLFAAAALWTGFVLPVAGILIYSLYTHEIHEAFDERLKSLLTIVIADSLDHAGAEPGIPGSIGEPLFDHPHSGWYWQITPLDGAPGTRRVSSSLGSETIPSPRSANIAPDAAGIRWLDAEGPIGQRLRIAEFIHSMGDVMAGPSYAFAVSAPLEWRDARIDRFTPPLVWALALAGLGLVLATLLQVRVGLNPLKGIEHGLADIRSGRSQRLEGRLPAEIQPLQQELNALIQSNQDIIERARTQVGNLAHGLKTPLAVILNEAREDKSPLALKVLDQGQIMQQQITHYLERARMVASIGAIGRSTDVLPIVEAIGRALTRIYRDRGIGLSIECAPDIRFQGEKQDLEEMLGNLMDNACKWARSTVAVSVRLEREVSGSTRPRLAILVDDDGPGMSEQQRKQSIKRGRRLDETKPGSGLGLSIVADLTQLYAGRFELQQAPAGGLRARLELPAI